MCDCGKADGWSGSFYLPNKNSIWSESSGIVDYGREIKNTCTWTESGDCYGYDTDCGDTFALNEGTPSNNGMKFCCYCGKPLEEKLYEEEAG